MPSYPSGRIASEHHARFLTMPEVGKADLSFGVGGKDFCAEMTLGDVIIFCSALN